MNIEIGSKKIKDLTPENLIDIALIEGVHLVTEYWERPKMVDFTNTLFSDTLVIDFNQIRTKDGVIGKTIVMYFNFIRFSFHWHFEDEENKGRGTKYIKIQTIKYLIENGYDLPLY